MQVYLKTYSAILELQEVKDTDLFFIGVFSLAFKSLN